MNKLSIYLLCIAGLSGCVTTPSTIGDSIKYQSRCSNIGAEHHKENEVRRPYHRARPIYPAEAKRQKIEGYVDIEFDLSASGVPINITVVESNSGEVFISAAKHNLKGTRYTPKLVDGKPVVTTCHIARLNFDSN